MTLAAASVEEEPNDLEVAQQQEEPAPDNTDTSTGDEVEQQRQWPNAEGNKY